MMTPHSIWPVAATLGEGPVWHPHEGRFYFVDIKRRQLHSCQADGQDQRSWTTPDEIGFALPMQAGGLVCGLPGRLARFTADGHFEPLLLVEPGARGNRLNDGYVDAAGRLWFGSMDNSERSASGALYRLDQHRLHLIEDGMIITNGPCHSPDGGTFYHTDTLARVVYAYACSPDGHLSGKREFVRFSTQGSGYPDGSTVDAAGHVWVALFGGSRIERYAPDGSLASTVTLPCPNITKVAFGGADLRTMLVTTARKGLDAAALTTYPLAGAIFTMRTAVPGLPQHFFRSKVG